MQSEPTNLEGLSGAPLLNPEQVLVFRDISIIGWLADKQGVPGITSDTVRER